VLAAAFEGDLTLAWRAQHQQVEPVEALLARVPAPTQAQHGRAATSRVIPGRAGISVNTPESPLPRGWRWVSLLRLARQETGHTPSRRNPEYWGGTIPWLGIKDASAHHGRRVSDTSQKITREGLDNSSARLLPVGTVCLSRTASVGYVTILDAEMATSQDFATWTCGAAILPDYLMYALMSEGPEIRRFGEGTVHTTIYFPEIRAFHIRLAPRDEQLEIVRTIRHAFGRIDQLSEAAEAAVQRLEVLVRRIMAQAFTGGLTSPEPGDGSAAELLARVRPPRPDALTPLSAELERRRDVAKSLEQVLQEAEDWLPSQEVFRRCGIGSGADTEAVEALFAELRALDQAKRLLTEPVLDSQGRKVQDLLRLAG
jgi:type I restriction enzyme S subunit